MRRVRIVLIDHRDSFTGNLYQDLGVLAGETPRVLSFDDTRLRSSRVTETLGDCELVVLGAGPGHPDHPRDAGYSPQVVRASLGRVPLFGVCLGLQLIARFFGGRVVPAADVVHGKSLPVLHRSRGLFAGLDSPTEMMRYHSFVVDPASLPEELQVTARSERGEIMALAHRQLPLWAVQFHPESIGSPHGVRLLRNLIGECLAGRSSADGATTEKRALGETLGRREASA